MSIRENDDGTDGNDPARAAASTIEAYETEESVVFYDAENPLAWVEATRTFELADLA